ncbi:MAG: nucleotide exchange factor GrpE [Candidatus Taylorbacteria bacterium RIFCSPHIGHO2_01_FULL_45_63]|uniref:Protein GrpE n=1 Tax=Candidatus Taylorbacteria bacterium RIFCSPHIGHO2_02_FULL_45_35 TaxID=1802311 RepID=A0A1G2MQP3_9BACT|nr:MAG: nucleotide exchange factor GrpE [Candidatus Taylorbacteria bacterium RIFCSPHIGHO2_01_FULL_45_63]OHA26217.1 MAG: nucleotide exchange factor GrpE [Candidatus Taylorbacteria bacterium RIFCSPHIGHO2_02_FULL_45_35]OHA32557.1 MAG: nucleotide exchange factor GrpE [Candidatus Taylorbacteria bacterium RIFCSPLOWO2_01_FULL_45_34b]
MNDENEKNDADIVSEDLDDSVVAEESALETVKKLREKLKKVTEEKQAYLNGWQKDKADFLNARKRDKEEKDQFIKFANENLITELLLVLQSFEIAFANKESWEKVDKNWRVGVEYIYNQLKSVLESSGLKEINPFSQKFDPTRDEAVEYVPVTDEKQNHVVIEVIQKGYSLNGRQLVAPKVKVGEYKE